MTLDSLISSLGDTSRNLGSHSLLLIQHQQVAHPSVQSSQHGPQKGCGGGSMLLQCAVSRLTLAKTKAQRRTRGVIVLSMESTAQYWLQDAASTAATNAAAASVVPKLILDACTHRFNSNLVSSTSPSITSPSATSNTSIQSLSTKEIKNLPTLRLLIEQVAERMHREYEKQQQQQQESGKEDGQAAANATPTISEPTVNPYALTSDLPSTDSFSCDTVTLIIDDLVSLFLRFGSSSVMAWLHHLKTSTRSNLSILASLDLDGLTTLSPSATGSGTGNLLVQHASIPLHTQLQHLATTMITVRSVHPLTQPSVATSAPTSTSAAATPPSSSPFTPIYILNIHLIHQRPSGKTTNVSEEMEINIRDGIVKKSAAMKAVLANVSVNAAAASSSVSAATSSLAAQFGSTFSLDLTSNAKSARANTVLPYQQAMLAGGSTGTMSSLDASGEDELLLTDDEDDDHDFDDPDDDLEI